VSALDQARYLAEAGRYADAEQHLRSALGATPDDEDLLIHLGYVLRRQDRYLDAIAACDAALAVAPGSAAAHMEKVVSLIAIFRGKQALVSATEAVRFAPRDADAYATLAKALAYENEYDRARDAARQALTLDAHSVPAWLALADLERDAGNPGPAGEAAREALRLDPSNTFGRWLLAMLDADRLKVGASLRTLSGVARDQAADADVTSLLWPLGDPVNRLRAWLPATAFFVVLTTLWFLPGPPVGAVVADAGRIVAGLGAVAVLALLARVLMPAGRVPWRLLRMVPPLFRHALLGGLSTVVTMVVLLAAFAATGWWPLPSVALLLSPVLWAAVVATLVGSRADDPGFHQALRDFRDEFRERFREWWVESRRELRKSQQDPPSSP
jgi:tetratricopeptide (TPR) repeat protein